MNAPGRARFGEVLPYLFPRGGIHMTILCIASYEKGHEFLRECKRQGCSVVLLTSESLKDKAQWPAESIDELFYMPDQNHEWNRADTIKAVSYLARTRAIDRIVALDDFDVEMAAALREHLRVPGMGETTVRHFRDKLAMRMKARESGLDVPDFVHVLNYDARAALHGERRPPRGCSSRAPWPAPSASRRFTARRSSGPPSMRSAICSRSTCWSSSSLAISSTSIASSPKSRSRFAIASGYGRPPMEVSHGGGIFTTRILERASRRRRHACWRKISA